MPKQAQKLPEHSHAVQGKRTDEAELVSDRAQPLDPRAIVQRAALAPKSLRPADILRLQQTLGNRAVGRLLSQLSPAPSLVQAKLAVNVPGDKYEQEADRIAEEVTQRPAVQRAELEDEEDEDKQPSVVTKPQPSPLAGGAFEAGEAFEQHLHAARGQGQALPPALKEDFETKFGADFGAVRVHADAGSAEMNRAIQAKAFTHAQDIYLGAGQYSPESTAGKRLLAHELTHVVQQVGEQIQPKEEGKQQLRTKTIPVKSIGVSQHSVQLDLIQRKYLDDPAGPTQGVRKAVKDFMPHLDNEYCTRDDVQKLCRVLVNWASKPTKEGLDSGPLLVEALFQKVRSYLKNMKGSKQSGEAQEKVKTFLEILRDIKTDIEAVSKTGEIGVRTEAESSEARQPAEEHAETARMRGCEVKILWANKVRNQWLEAHNNAREAHNRTIEQKERKIPLLEWDNTLAEQAKELVNKKMMFVWGNQKEPIIGGTGSFNTEHFVPSEEVGQNIATWEETSTSMEALTSQEIFDMPGKSVKSWIDEERVYLTRRGAPKIDATLSMLPRGFFLKGCGHYTQVIWPETTKVGGCIALYQTQIGVVGGRNKEIRRVYAAICNYSPRGNTLDV
jgi:hypothetical protein